MITSGHLSPRDKLKCTSRMWGLNMLNIKFGAYTIMSDFDENFAYAFSMSQRPFFKKKA